MTGIEFALNKRELVRKKSNAWKLQSHPLKEDDISVLKETLVTLGADNKKVNSLIKEKQDNLNQKGREKEYQHVLVELTKSLKDDLSVYTDGEYSNILEHTGLEMIELGHIHAAVVNKNDYDDILDGYAIFINLGTYYALQLLTKAIIVENFIDDFSQYKRDGKEYIELAMHIYNTKSSNPTREIFWYDYPPEVQSQASAAQSASSIKVLQFMVLHELGHCVYNHFDIMEFHSFSMHHSDITDLPKTINITTSHKFEFEADKFAFEKLFKNNSDPIPKWSSLYPIFYFFVWLNAVEKRNKKKSSNLHPNALTRAKRLRNMMMELTLGNDYGYGKHFDDIIQYFEKWSQNDT